MRGETPEYSWDRRVDHARTRPAPLAWPAIGLIVGVALADHFDAAGKTFRLALVGVALSTATAGMISAGLRWKRFARSAGWACAIALGFLRFQGALDRPADHIGHRQQSAPVSIHVRGIVQTRPADSSASAGSTETSYGSDRATFVLRLLEEREDAGAAPLRGIVRVSVALPKSFRAIDLKLAPGDTVDVLGALLPTRQVRNPGEIDWERVQWLKGIDARLACAAPENIRTVSRAANSVTDLRERFRALARRTLLDSDTLHDAPPASRLLDAMILGQRSSTGRAVDEAFARAGAIHFLSVSGFHVAVLVGSAFLVARVVTRGSRIGAGILTLAFLGAYVFLAETNSPMVRTVIGVVLLVVGGWLGRPVSPLNWLAAAAIMILLVNPRELFRPGFQLSFVQVAFLLVVFAPLQRLIKSTRRDTGNLFLLGWRMTWRVLLVALLLSFGAWLVSLPIVLWHFERLTLLGPVGALLVTPIITLVLWLSFAALLASFILPPAASALEHGTRWLTDRTLDLVNLIAAQPGANIDSLPPPLWLVLLSYAIVATAASVLSARLSRSNETVRAARVPWMRRVLVMSTATAVLAVAWGVWNKSSRHIEPGRLTLQVFDAGRGPLALLSADGAGCLIDAGGATPTAAQLVQRAARYLNVGRIESIVLTHSGPDAFHNLEHLAGVLNPQTLALSPGLAYAPRRTAARRMYLRLTADHANTDADLGSPRSSPILPHTGDVLPWAANDLQVLWPPSDRADLSIEEQALVLQQHCAGGAILIVGNTTARALQGLMTRDAAGELSLRSHVLLITAPLPESANGHWVEFLDRVRPQWICINRDVAAERAPVPTNGPWPQMHGGISRYLNTRDVGAITISWSPSVGWKLATLIQVSDPP